MLIHSVYLWANGMVMVFDEAGEQVPHLQGAATVELLQQIRSESSLETSWNGFDESGPLEWDPRRPTWSVR